MEQRNRAGLANLALAKYRISCRAQEKILLPSYKGSALHGGFGFALKAVSAFYYKKFCQPPSGPNPYILLPPLDKAEHYPPGHVFSFELTLAGSAAAYFPVCRDALEHLGKQLGFGKNRGKFEIISLDSAVPPIADDSLVQNPLIRGDVIAASRPRTDSRELTLHFITPLRLKEKDRLLLSPPPFSIFFARLLGRLNSLAIFYGEGAVITPEEKQNLLEKAKTVKIIEDKTRRQDLARFSTRQKQWMKFDGLMGSLVYGGDFSLFVPFLAVGEWLHVGGKTSFGFGKYVMDAGKLSGIAATK